MRTLSPILRREMYREMLPFSYAWKDTLERRASVRNVHGAGRRGTVGAKTHLDEQVEVAKVVVAACGRIAPHDVLAIDFRSHGDVLPNRKTEDVI